MPLAEIFHQVVWMNGAAVVMAHMTGNDGNNILQANISVLTAHAYDVTGTSPDTDVLNATLVKTTEVFDTLQTSDPRWTLNTTGFNFLYSFPASVFSRIALYRCEVKFTPTSGDIFRLPLELQALETKS